MDNKIDVMLTKAIRILLIAIICIMLTIGAIFILPPSYAINDFENQPIPKNSTTDRTTLLNVGYEFYSYPFKAVNNTVDNDVYVFAVPTTNSTNITFYFVSKDQGRVSYTTNNLYNTTQANLSNQSGDYRFASFSYSSSQYQATCPVYDSFSEGIEALDEYINNSGSLSYNSTITIEPGYVAYCLCEGGSVVLNTIMPLNSNLNIAGKPKWDSMARIAFGVQRPTSGTTITNTFGDLINWQKNGTAPSNILGMTKYAQAIYNDLPSDGSFVAIYNPAYYGDDMSNPTQAPSITATFTNLGAVAKYPMNTHVAYTPLSGWNVQSGSDSDWEEYGIAVPTTDGAITTTDYIMSTTSQPAIEFQDGGYNDSSSVNNDAGSVLQRIIQPIINLLKAPIEHINSLIAQGSAFMRSISQLFTWLPSPVLTVLIDALIVCIVIGAIKLLF